MKKTIAAAFIGTSLSGCGTYPPQHAEFWARSDTTTSQKVTSIAAQVKCELARAVQKLNTLKLDWVNSWGALVTFTLDTTEKSSFNPGVNFITPLPTAITTFTGLADVTTSQGFNTSIGAQISSETERKSAVTYFYTAQELQKLNVAGMTCVPSIPTPGFLFVESELGIDQWVFATASLQTTNIAKFPTLKAEKGYLNQNTISETIKFDVITSGNATPTWKLVRVAANESTPFVEGRRERVQQLDITLGPLDAAPGQLAPTAQSQFSANLIAAALARRLRQ